MLGEYATVPRSVNIRPSLSSKGFKGHFFIYPSSKVIVCGGENGKGSSCSKKCVFFYHL